MALHLKTFAQILTLVMKLPLKCHENDRTDSRIL